MPPNLDQPAEAERAGHEAAHHRLTRVRADALIWGSVVRQGDETRVKLRWTPAPDLAVARDFGRYETADDLTLPPLLWSDLNPVLRLLGATYVVDVRGLEARAAADAFFPFVVPVYDTLAKPSEGTWSAATGARIAPVLANALFRYAEQTGQSQILDDAVTIYRDVLATYARWQQPLDWARAESHLGAALATLGEWASDPVRLEQAGNAFHAALWEQTPEGSSRDWAKTKMKLGNALTTLGTLGEQKANTPRLEEAVTAYRVVLTEETRERMPLAWAATQNSLGNVLKALGDLEVDSTRMEEAVTAYRAALTVGTRKRMPLHWATVQSNLASALARLGEARSDPSRLKEAVKAYRAALKERPRERMPLVWAATQNNLGNALRTLGQIESDMAHMEKAADAYTAALAEFSRAKAESQIEMTKRNLERTLKTLNERKKS
jgi:tetratricopeptide (TPR) repeat protein